MADTLFMRDFSMLDSRSVKAQLNGRGDGREKRFARFVRTSRNFTPNISDEALRAAFSKAEAEREAKRDAFLVGANAAAEIMAPWLKRGFYVGLAVAVFMVVFG